MIAASDTALTLGGFLALASLGLATIALVVSLLRSSSSVSDRVTRLEQILEDHLKNGLRHDRKE